MPIFAYLPDATSKRKCRAGDLIDTVHGVTIERPSADSAADSDSRSFSILRIFISNTCICDIGLAGNIRAVITSRYGARRSRQPRIPTFAL